MNTEEIKALAEKVKNDTATPEEELQLLQELNQGVDALRAFVKEIAVEQKKAEIEHSL